MPALLTSTSNSPWARPASSASRRTSASEARSATYDPLAATSRAVSETRSGSRPWTSTRAPRPARSAASARPRPSVAPVMSTVRPSIDNEILGRRARRAQDLLTRRRAHVEHAPAVALGRHEPRAPEDAEVLGDPGRRGVQARGEVLRRGRRAQRPEDPRPAAAEQRIERAGVRLGRRPQRPDAARRVDQRRLPRLVDHREDLRPGEDARHEQQSAPAQRDVLLVAVGGPHRALPPTPLAGEGRGDPHPPPRGP